MKVIIFVTFAFCLCNAQFFGGRTHGRYGGYTNEAGFRKGPVWGSMSQDFNSRGMSNPITYNAGLEKFNSRGHGISAQTSHVPKYGGDASVQGRLGLINNDNTKLYAFAQHDRYLNPHFKPIGPETNSAGIKLESQNGPNAFATVSKMNGYPSSKSVGGSVPVYTNGDTKLSVGGSKTTGGGRPNNKQIEVNFETTF